MEELDQKEVDRLRSEIDSVQSRFFHLLSITSIVMMVLAGGFVLRLFPKLIWNLETLETLESERYYIPQLLCGLFCLVALLCWYVLQQRRSLKNTQKQLISELIRRETAERLAVIDPLTEMYNRRYIMRAIASETARADRQDLQFAFLMIDLDDFKRANDALGHLTGDRILRELAQLLRKTFRTSDIISRFGGDEFLALLIDSDEPMAIRAAERLQEAVADWNKEEPIKGYTMAVSCGSAVYQKGADAIAVLAAADQAMYQNKSGSAAEPQAQKASSAAV
jgi:diguanylate cyclase (GGDEF)-like protein